MSSKTVYSNEFFEVVLQTNGRSNFYSILAPDSVMVVARIGQEYCLVRGSRHSVSSKVCYEFPGGIIDSGESPTSAARREFMEETGFCIDRLQFVTTVYPIPAISNAKCHLFIADVGASCVRRTLEDGENWQVFFADSSEILDLVERGCIFDSNTLAAVLACIVPHRDLWDGLEVHSTDRASDA